MYKNKQTQNLEDELKTIIFINFKTANRFMLDNFPSVQILLQDICRRQLQVSIFLYKEVFF